MEGSRKKLFQFAIIMAIALLASSAMAEDLLLTLSQEEYSWPSRVGTLEFYDPDDSSPLEDKSLDTGLWIEAEWDPACDGSIRVPGGTAKGWLLGPITEGGFLEVHSALFDTEASDVFGMVIDRFGSLGSGKRVYCNDSSSKVGFGYILIFILEEPEGKHVGDLLYMTAINPRGDWYKLTLK